MAPIERLRRAIFDGSGEVDERIELLIGLAVDTNLPEYTFGRRATKSCASRIGQCAAGASFTSITR